MTDYNEVAIGGEGTPSQTFNFTPDYIIPVKEQFDGIRKKFERDYEQTFPKFSKTRRRYQLKFMSRTETERDNIFAFIEARVGAKEAFYFTPEDETSPISVCAIESSVKSVKVSPGIYNLSLELLELY